MHPHVGEAQQLQGDSTGEWLLVATFAGDARTYPLIAYGNDPSIPPNETGFQQLKRLKYSSEVVRKLIEIPTSQTIRTKATTTSSKVVRGKQLSSFTDPVISGTGNVHAVWVWIGPSGSPISYDHPMTGGWEWNLTDTKAIHVTYGPNIPEIYGRDWTVGQPYPLHTTADTIWTSGMTAVAQLLESGKEGDRHTLKGIAGRPVKSPRNNEVSLISIQAATEIAQTPGGRVWRGVTWETTNFEVPQLDPQQALVARLAMEARGWTAIVYWVPSWSTEPGKFPIQVARWEGRKVIPGLWTDPITGRARVHPDDRGLPHKWAISLERSDHLATELRLWGLDGLWHRFDLRIERISGTRPPAATVRVTLHD